MKIFIGTLVSLFAIGSSVWAATYCDDPSVRSVRVPVYPDRIGSAEFQFSYQWVQAEQVSDFTIVVLPGGPGGTGIYDLAKSISTIRAYGIPSDVNVIMVDPRTAGCNYVSENFFPVDSLTTVNLSRDVLSVIRYLDIKNFAIFGHSYGSQWATVLASLASQDGGFVPVFTFISGVIGKGTSDGTNSIYYGLNRYWEELKSMLSPDAVRLINQDSALGISNQNWNLIVAKGLYRGRVWVTDHVENTLLNLLTKLNDSNIDQVKSELYQFSGIKPPTEFGILIQDLFYPSFKPLRDIALGPNYSEELFDEIDCSEITNTEPVAEFSKGRLVYTKDECSPEKFTRPFDAKDWPIQNPIYYLQGDHDPACPIEGARYHFSVTTNNGAFITVPGGGHSYIKNLKPSCATKFWQYFRSATQDSLVDISAECEADLKVEVR